MGVDDKVKLWATVFGLVALLWATLLQNLAGIGNWASLFLGGAGIIMGLALVQYFKLRELMSVEFPNAVGLGAVIIALVVNGLQSMLGFFGFNLNLGLPLAFLAALGIAAVWFNGLVFMVLRIFKR